VKFLLNDCGLCGSLYQHPVYHTVRVAFFDGATCLLQVGYGDRTPKSFLGRVNGAVLMMVAMVVTSSFVATFTEAVIREQSEFKVAAPLPLCPV